MFPREPAKIAHIPAAPFVLTIVVVVVAFSVLVACPNAAAV
jgi:hypothetical protein